MWRFRPVESFELDRTQRAYRTYQWTLVIAAPVLTAMSWWLYVYPQHLEAATNAPVYAAIAIQAIIAGVIYGGWILKGIDLRSSWGQAVALLVPVGIAPLAFMLAGAPQAIPAGMVAAFLSASSLVTSLGPMWAGIVPVGTVLAYSVAIDAPAPMYFSFIVYAVAVWVTFKSSVWYLDILRAMEETAQAQTTMRLAEERLRFAADLHDIMGQRLAAISLQAQTAGQLARQGGDPSAPIEAIVELADQSMTDMRAMVTTYQVPEWNTELPGAVSLLKASGARVTVTGKPPTSMEQEAAYIIREATTNILKHSNATDVSVVLDSAGMKVSNNGVDAADAGRSWTGLAALQRRLSPTTLSAETVDDTFILSAEWNQNDRDV